MKNPRTRLSITASSLALLALVTPLAPPLAAAPSEKALVQPEEPPVRVFLYTGLKTHYLGEHDYPQFLADWSKLLMRRNAIVDGALHFPSARALGQTDVLVIYRGDAGYLGEEDRANLDTYLRRGGGLVSVHDSLCGPAPEEFAALVGGAKRHGQVNYTFEADIKYKFVDPDHPILKGLAPFSLRDESFFNLTWAKDPEIHVLATAATPATPTAKGHEGEVVPQIWTYERQLVPAPNGQPYRAFVWMQGHNYATFGLPNVQTLLLRGIAWAAKRPVGTLLVERNLGPIDLTKPRPPGAGATPAPSAPNVPSAPTAPRR